MDHAAETEVHAGASAPAGAILAIDQGTSSTKAMVFDPDGVVAGRASVDVRPRFGPDGAVEQDPREVLDSVLDAGRTALQRAGGDPPAIVSIANQGETVLAWDPESGSPFGPAISWQDRRAAELCHRWDDAAWTLRRETGVPPDPYFAAPKMRWLRETGRRGGVLTTLDAWLTWQLTGAFVTDAATASRTGLLELAGTRWSDTAVDIYGLGRERLPDIVGCADVVGTTSSFGRPTPVGGLIVDQQASLFGHGCRAVGDLKCTTGTGAFLLAIADMTALDTRTLITSIAWRLGDRTTYCLDAQVFAAGAALSWLTRLGLLDSAASVDDAYGRATSDSVQFVPALAGWGAPRPSPQASASWTGMTAATSAQDLVKAVVDGVAAAIAAAAQAIEHESGVRTGVLRLDGGLTRSAALVQRIADLLQIPVSVRDDHDLTSRGVAELGCIALGQRSRFATPHDVRLVEPRLSADAAGDASSRWQAALDFALEQAAHKRN